MTKEDKEPTSDKIQEQLFFIKQIPDHAKKDIEKLDDDRKRAKRDLIWPCVIFGIIILFQLITLFVRIFTGELTGEIFATTFLVITMDAVFILYEVLMYNNKMAMIDMYQLNREMSARWAETFIKGLEREAELSAEILKLKGGKNGSNNSRKSRSRKSATQNSDSN